MKYGRNKKNSIISNKFILLVFIIVLCLVSVGYSLLSTELQITGTASGEYDPILYAAPVKQQGERYSVNTSFTQGLIFRRDVFAVNSDTINGNMIITNLRNNRQTILNQNLDVTFTITLQNTTGGEWTGGTIVQDSEVDSGNRMSTVSCNLSTLSVADGQSVNAGVQIRFTGTDTSFPVGSYIQYKITFYYKGAPRNYYYRVYIES